MWLLVDTTFNPPLKKASDARKTKQPSSVCLGRKYPGPRLTDKPMGSDGNYGAAAVGLTQNAKSAQKLSFKDIGGGGGGGGLPCAQHKG